VTPSDDPNGDPRYRVEDDDDGVIRATVEQGWMTKPLAQAMCADIEKAAARHPGRARLMLDAGAMSKATPGAGMYAMKRIKALNLNGVALYRANGFMRSFARSVMRLARFGRFDFFRDEKQARDWLEQGPAARDVGPR
jgi:hypothetical protein